MSPLRVALAVSVLLALLVSAQAEEPVPPQADQPANTYLRRTTTQEGKPKALEAAIVRFEPAGGQPEGLVVDLVGAVHVAEAAYYDQLNEEFKKYDVVLYELVAPRGARPQPGQQSGSALSTLQYGMTDMLNLEFQLDGIDYAVPNMVHADMSPEQFDQSMEDRGESFLTMFARMTGYSMARQSGGTQGTSDMDLLVALFSKDRALAMKRVMAQQFEDMEGVLSVLTGPQGSTIISERNKAALDVLREQIDAGKKRIAIFYGAGHMPDMGERLEKDFGLRATETRWLVAWDLQASAPAAKPASPRPE